MISALQQSRENNPEERCVMEATELAGSVRSGDIEHVKILLGRGVTTDFMTTEGQPLLMLCGNIETAKLLLEKGAQVDITDGRGWSALQCAARDGNLESLKHFLSYGARIRARTGERSALHDAVYFNHPHVVAFLLASGAEADVNAAGEMDLPIHWAARHPEHEDVG